MCGSPPCCKNCRVEVNTSVPRKLHSYKTSVLKLTILLVHINLQMLCINDLYVSVLLLFNRPQCIINYRHKQCKAFSCTVLLKILSIQNVSAQHEARM